MKFCNHPGCEKFRIQQATNGSYCSFCGNKLFSERQPLYVGVDRDRGTYRITFAPVEDEFEHSDHANDAARHSSWGEDRELSNWTIEKVSSSVPIKDFPFICGNCKEYVHSRADGNCASCGEENWVPRTEKD